MVIDLDRVAIRVLHPRGADSASGPGFDGQIPQVGGIGEKMVDGKLQVSGQPQRQHQTSQTILGRGDEG